MAKQTKSNTIVHPRYGCAIGAAYTVAAIPGAVPIANCGPGCVDKQYFGLSGSNGLQGSGVASGGDMPSVNFGENEVVFGGAKKLDGLIKSSLKIVKGDLFVVLTGCSGELIGDDVASVVKSYRNQGYNVIYADTAGFKGNNVRGHEIVVKAIIDQYVGSYKGKRRKTLINLWSEVPYFNTFWRGDIAELKRVLEGAGFEVNIFFGPQSKGLSEWKNIPKAAFNLVVSPWVGVDIAKHLEQKYGQPYLHIPVLPVGEEATSEFLRKVVEFSGISPDKAERFIEQEAHEYYYYLEHFADFFAEYWFGLPSKFAAVGESSYNIALTKFLSDQVGLIPVRQIITEDPPEKYREDISALYHDLTDGVEIEPEYIEDGYLIEQALYDTDFGSSVPLILGTSWERDIAAEHRGLLLEVGTPATEEVVINRSYIGYRGALTLLEKIYTSTVGGK